MASLQKTLSSGATLSLVALILAVVAYATECVCLLPCLLSFAARFVTEIRCGFGVRSYWARYSNNWVQSGICNVDYKFNWGLYRYDSTTKYTCNDVLIYKLEIQNEKLDWCEIFAKSSLPCRLT